MTLSLLMAISGAQASDEKGEGIVHARLGAHLQASSQIRDLLNHPAFSGYARLLLPWDDRHYDERMPLSQLGTLLESATRFWNKQIK